jgi:hypothetical protein
MSSNCIRKCTCPEAANPDALLRPKLLPCRDDFEYFGLEIGRTVGRQIIRRPQFFQILLKSRLPALVEGGERPVRRSEVGGSDINNMLEMLDQLEQGP